MKKLIFAAAFVFAAVAANAQVVDMKSTSSKATDTVTNTGSEVLTAQVNGYQADVTIQAVVTKVSGTVAGTVVLQGSVDGSNYVTLTTTALPGGNDTCTLTNTATQSFNYAVGQSKYLYYRVRVTGSGTMVAIINAKLLARKP